MATLRGEPQVRPQNPCAIGVGGPKSCCGTPGERLHEDLKALSLRASSSFPAGWKIPRGATTPRSPPSPPKEYSTHDFGGGSARSIRSIPTPHEDLFAIHVE